MNDISSPCNLLSITNLLSVLQPGNFRRWSLIPSRQNLEFSHGAALFFLFHLTHSTQKHCPRLKWSLLTSRPWIGVLLFTVLKKAQIYLVKLAPSIFCSGQLVTVLGLYFEKLGLYKVFSHWCLFRVFLKKGSTWWKQKNMLLST